MLEQRLKHVKQRLHIQGVQADGRLVKDKNRVLLAASHFTGQFQPLGLASRQAGGGLPQSEIPQPQILQNLQALAHQFQIPAGFQRPVHVQGHQGWQGVSLPVFSPVKDLFRLFPVPGSPALGTGNFHVRQKLHIQADRACAVAQRAAQFSCVVGKVPRFVPVTFSVGRTGEDLSQFVVNAGVGGDGRAHVEANGGGINQFHPVNPLGLQIFHVGGKVLPAAGCL